MTRRRRADDEWMRTHWTQKGREQSCTQNTTVDARRISFVNSARRPRRTTSYHSSPPMDRKHFETN